MSERPLLQTVQVNVAELRPNDRNPRRISKERFEALKTSLEADPDMLVARPVIALPDGTIIGGNQRYRAAVALGWSSIPVVYADLDEDRAKTWMFRDNRPYGEDDDDLTAELLYELEQSQRDLLPLTGFADEDLQRLLESVRGAAVFPQDPDAVPPLPDDPESKLGEIYELGPHRLICGDVTDPEVLAALMQGAKANVGVTSPPYNQGIDKFKPSGMQKENPAWIGRMAGAYSDSRPEAEYEDEQVAVLDSILAVTDDAGAFFYNHKNRYRAKVMISPLDWVRRTQWRIRQEIVWDRSGSITLNARMFMPSDERIYWLTKTGEFLFNDSAETKSWSTVWQIAPRVDVQVSAPFPVEIPWRCIKAASKPGDIVLEPYAGSGTTLIAAEMLGRVCYAVEVDPAYCDVIRTRYAEFTG